MIVCSTPYKHREKLEKEENVYLFEKRGCGFW